VKLALCVCEVTAAGYGQDPARQAAAMGSSVVSKYRALSAVERWLNSFQSIENCFGDLIFIPCCSACCQHKNGIRALNCNVIRNTDCTVSAEEMGADFERSAHEPIT